LLPVTTRRSLPISLLRARELVMARFRPMLARHDVTEQQWRVIRVLGEESPLGASEVAVRAAILGPSLTRIIKALEARGMITRDVHASDARRVDLAITPERRSIFEEIERKHGRPQLDALLDLLEELIVREESAGGI